MPELPTGTVTFLFSDIEGSTRLAASQGEAWPGLLARHHDLVRSALEAEGGHIAGTEGDSFFAAFPGAAEAVRAGVAVQRALSGERWPAGAAIQVRIGLHTGESRLGRDGAYVGLDVHRAARIMSAGHGGQVLLSSATREVVEAALPPGVQLVELGVHRLKDFDAPERISQLAIDGLPAEFPSLRTVDIGAASLPSQATSFVGREGEIADVRALLAGHRLVTLTGPGGTGKTRLSLEVARQELDRFDGNVAFVALAPIREVELVLPTIAKAVGVPDPGPRPLERIVERLAGKRALLVLDNLEQVVAAGADIGELVSQADGVSVLASSRSPLRVYGEQEYPVPPLELPDPRLTPPDETVVRYPAVALFVERARAVNPAFAVTAENAPAVAEICWRLDGLPLAIELAAARIRILTPQAMLARLAKRLDLGAGGARDLPERQQTLRGAIAWSHEILDDADQASFAHFSVFSGGADWEAAEAVLGPCTPELLGALESLIDKSLLLQEPMPDGSTRFRMLETIREYAQERLDERTDADELRQRHAAHFLALAERHAARVFTDEQRVALDAIEAEHDNVRAAIAWATERPDSLIALRLVAACWRFWQMRGYVSEGLERVRRALALPEVDDHPRELADALEAAGGLDYWQGAFASALRSYGRQLELERQLGNDAAVANALYNMAMSYGLAGSAGTPPIEIPPEAERHANEALEIFRRLGDRGGEGRALWAIMDMRVLQRRTAEASELGARCLEIFREVGDHFMLAWTEHMLGMNANLAADRTAAREHFTHALELFRETKDLSGYALVLDGFAGVAYIEGDVVRAMQLAGAADAVQRQAGTLLGAINRNWADFKPERLLGDPALARAYEEGRRLDLDRVFELALETTPV